MQLLWRWGTIQGIKTVIAAFDFRFMGGSMGRTVGDGLLKVAETAVAEATALDRSALIRRCPNAGRYLVTDATAAFNHCG